MHSFVSRNRNVFAITACAVSAISICST